MQRRRHLNAHSHHVLKTSPVVVSILAKIAALVSTVARLSAARARHRQSTKDDPASTRRRDPGPFLLSSFGSARFGDDGVFMMPRVGEGAAAALVYLKVYLWDVSAPHRTLCTAATAQRFGAQDATASGICFRSTRRRPLLMLVRVVPGHLAGSWPVAHRVPLRTKSHSTSTESCLTLSTSIISLPRPEARVQPSSPPACR